MATPRKVKLPVQLTAVEDLLLWHDVTKSGIVLGAATALYVLLEWSGLPLLTWLSNLGLVVVLGAVLWAIGARFMGSTGPSEHLPALLRTGLDEAAVRGIAERGRVAANAVLALLGRLLTGADLPLAGKACAVLYITGWVGRVITPVGLLYLVILALFTLPKVYEMRKEEIDGAVLRARDAAAAQYSTARTMANDYIQKLTPMKARPAASDISKDE